MDRVLASGARDESSTLSGGTIVKGQSIIGAWPSGRAPGLGPGGRQFDPGRPDH